MEPNFYEGDHVLTLNWIKPKVNDVVVFKNEGNFYLKRITKIKRDLFYVGGDNLKRSSRFGVIKKSQIIGKVVMKY